jgi:predicted restriction endonuclease
MSDQASQAVTLDQVTNAFQALYEALQDAYWDASDIQTKDQITGVMEVVSDILTDLDQQGVQQDNAALTAIKQQIASIQTKLDTLKTQIDSIIHNVATATQVASAIDTAVSYASKFGLLA